MSVDLAKLIILLAGMWGHGNPNGWDVAAQVRFALALPGPTGWESDPQPAPRSLNWPIQGLATPWWRKEVKCETVLALKNVLGRLHRRAHRPLELHYPVHWPPAGARLAHYHPGGPRALWPGCGHGTAHVGGQRCVWRYSR